MKKAKISEGEGAYGKVPISLSIHQVTTLAIYKDEKMDTLLISLSEKKKTPNLEILNVIVVPRGNSSDAISLKRNRTKTKKK